MSCYFSKGKYVTKEDPSLCLTLKKQKKAPAKSVCALANARHKHSPSSMLESVPRMAGLTEETEAHLQINIS